MKKYISLLLISVLILLSGCGMTVTKVENTTADRQNIITDEYITTSTTNSETNPMSVKSASAGKTISTTKSVKTKTTTTISGGTITTANTVSVAEGSTVFDVLKLVCKQNTCPEKCSYCRKSGIQLEYVYTPGYDSEYIRGIHQLYEKDCGTQSGWMYSVNGVFPNYGVNKYTVKNGDDIKFRYTCNGFGEDLGANFMG